MSAAIERLQDIRIADSMSREVITISASSTMADAASVLVQHNISGAPVINEFGQCIGVLSTTDFTRRDQSPNCDSSLPLSANEYMLVQDEGAGPFHIEYVAEDSVSQHMSCAPQAIDSELSLVDAARYMHVQHIHRVIVVDDRARPIGVISSLDVIAALVEPIEEV